MTRPDSPFDGWTGETSIRGFDANEDRVELGDPKGVEWCVYLRCDDGTGPLLDWFCAEFTTERAAKICADVLREAFRNRDRFAEGVTEEP